VKSAAVIREHSPEIVFNATTPFPWWRINDLPQDLSDLANRVGPGIWAPLDVLLPTALTDAIEQSLTDPIHVNACYPDLTNAFLGGRKGAPLVGIGNISNLIPGFQIAYAAEWGVDPLEVKIQFIGHHFSSLNGPSSSSALPAPFILDIKAPGREVRIVGPSHEPFAVLRHHARRVRGETGQAVTTGSAATVLSAFMSGKEERLHCPGALGLPGGYPVLIDTEGRTSLDLPSGVTRLEAVAVNEAAQYFDGISSVGPGFVRPSEEALSAQERILGFTTPDVDTTNFRELSTRMIQALNKRHLLELEQV
jgi:hypothetical protein